MFFWTGNMMDMNTIEQFVGGEVSLERIMDFVGDVPEEEITAFVAEVQNMDPAVIQNLVAEFEGEIPGVSAEECGNYRDHDLKGAKEEAAKMYEVLFGWTADKLTYPKK